MSGQESAWNADSPQHWAQALGLVEVPLFGSERARSENGSHAMLLDGDRGSFVLSTGGVNDDEQASRILSWSWSSNVTFSLSVRQNNRIATLQRWDEPETLRRVKIDSSRSARVLFEKMTLADRPSAPSAVQRLISVFRSLRRALASETQPSSVIRVFNAFLLGAEAVRRNVVTKEEWLGCGSLNELQAVLASKGVISAVGSTDLSTPSSFLVSEFADVFLERDPATNCTLDADLLLRHASGALYQEAHIELERPPHVQGHLFGIPSGSPILGKSRPDARFTAPPLARMLAECALEAWMASAGVGTGQKITILDPACGSGVFLVEAWRELQSLKAAKNARLVGYDQSSIACEMAEFCLTHTVDSDSGADVYIGPRDSLGKEAWESADVILMNPPFTAWNDMSDSERTAVRRILGDLFRDHADKSLAFIHKAIQSLKPGAVLASVLPAPILESRAALLWRKNIADDPSLSIKLIGCFRGFNYFRGAVVEPAFIVVAKSHGTTKDGAEPIQIILANDGYEDQAIRQLRRDPLGDESESQEWSVFQSPSSEISPASWLPRSRAASSRLRALGAKGLPTVAELFKVKLGMRTGHNKAFIFKSQDLTRMGLPQSEQEWFLAAAGNSTIRSGRLLDTHRVFYPYVEGQCAFSTEEQLKKAVPVFYNRVLLGEREALKARKSIRDRKWWELVEPRPTWQGVHCPKIVSAYFGQRGSFAYDADGVFAVTQGFGWLWRHKNFASSPLPWAYLAILNSRMFQGLLAHFCPTVRGGQYDLSVRFVEKIPLPNLMDDAVITTPTITRLADYGRRISTGRFPPLDSLDGVVSRVYGLPACDWIDGQA